MKNKAQEKYIKKGKRYTLFFNEENKPLLELAKKTAKYNEMSFQKYVNTALFAFPIVMQSITEVKAEYEKEGKDASAINEIMDRVSANMATFFEEK